ncbi:MAG: YgiT-type zinc finger protein, partial [Selenomonadaceae bacterium]|nr:YgiT-type zinc finger protein [Selenomonadaceae bacterium]
CLIIIKNVPCVECVQCGEKYYTDEVAQPLDEIISAAKKITQEISVIYYQQAA